jgi:V/A-type H+-transporting ATPase subunit E
MKRRDVEALREAVMSDVERDRQRILKNAQSQAQSTLAQARREAEVARAGVIEGAEAEVERVRQQVIGAARLEAQALKARMREELLDRVFRQALERISDPDHIEGYADVLSGLIEDAVEHLKGHERLIIIADPKSTRYLNDEFLARLSDLTGRELSASGDAEAPGVGVVLTSPDGRIRYDNTLQTRLGRMRDALRPVVYRTLMGEEA